MFKIYLDRDEIYSKTSKPIKHCSYIAKYKGEVMELLEKGKQRKEVAQCFSVSKQTLFHFFKLNRIEYVLSCCLNDFKAKITEIFMQNIALNEMALHYKNSPKMINQKKYKMKLLRFRSDIYNKLINKERFKKQIFEDGFSCLAIIEAFSAYVQIIKNTGLKRDKIGNRIKLSNKGKPWYDSCTFPK